MSDSEKIEAIKKELEIYNSSERKALGALLHNINSILNEEINWDEYCEGLHDSVNV